MRDEINSYFGDGVSMRGLLRFKGALRFDGHFQGEIETKDTLIIGNTAKIEAKIETGSLFNMGEILGNVRATRKISIFSDSNLTGNIDTPAFISQEGAIFKGNCSMSLSSKGNVVDVKEAKFKQALTKDYPELLAQTDDSFDSDWIEGSTVRRRGKWAKRIVLAFVLVLILALPTAYFGYKSVNEVGGMQVQRTIYEVFGQDDPRKMKILGDTYFREGKYAKAIEIYKRVMLLTPDETSISKKLAVSFEKTGRKDESIGYFEKALKADPDDGEIIDKLEANYKFTNNIAKLTGLREFIVKHNPDDKDAINLLYGLYLKGNNLEKSLELFRRELASSPMTIEDLLVIGRMEKKLDRMHSAIKTFASAVSIGPKNHDARLELAYAYHKTGYEDKAVEQFFAIARLDPNHVEAINSLGFSYLSRGNTDKSIERFNMALAESPGNLRSYLGLATTYSRLGAWEKAEYYCKRILDIDPNYSPALNRLAWTYAQGGGDLDEAEKYSLASMKYDNELPDYLDTLSEVYYKKKNYDKAIELIEDAIGFSPANNYFKSQLNKFKLAKRRAAPKN